MQPVDDGTVAGVVTAGQVRVVDRYHGEPIVKSMALACRVPLPPRVYRSRTIPYHTRKYYWRICTT